jgi:hypothetical protein
MAGAVIGAMILLGLVTVGTFFLVRRLRAKRTLRRYQAAWEHIPAWRQENSAAVSVTSTVSTGQAQAVLDVRPPSTISINATQYVASTLHVRHDLTYCLLFPDQEQRITPFRKLFLLIRKFLALAKQV